MKLDKYFPKQWTHISQIDWLPFLFALKLSNYDWLEISDVAKIMAFMEKKGLIEHDGYCIRLKP